jgi:hypothetical protein
VYPFMQDRHDPDIPMRQPPPTDEMMRVPEVETIHPELGRDGA